MKRKVLVAGAGGFIGSHLVRRLTDLGVWVRGVDLKRPEYSDTTADEFVLGDLRDLAVCDAATSGGIGELYQLAAHMGGAGYIFTGDHDADIMRDSAAINLNLAHMAQAKKIAKLFYASSACIYPERNQLDPDNPNCAEDTAYPAAPDSDYGWEKLFSERMFMAFARNHGIDIHIARLHNVFGPEGTWTGSREKAPAAICRKVAEAPNGGVIEVWGDGKQTRSFLYVDECIEGILRLMGSGFMGPVNLGSEEKIAINDLARMAVDISGKELRIRNIPGPLGARGRNSDNRLIREKLGWAPSAPLRDGMQITYRWIARQVASVQAVV